MGRHVHLLLAIITPLLYPLTHVSSFLLPLHLQGTSPRALSLSSPDSSVDPLDDEVVLDIKDLANLLEDVGGVDNSAPEPTLEDLAKLEAALSEEVGIDDIVPSPSLSSPSSSLPTFLLNQKNQRLLSAIASEAVPLSARVGSGSLPADAGFDPLSFSTLDPFKILHRNRLTLLTGEEPVQARPPSLILRDYRDCEVRHSRLAMLAAVIWPLQELSDRFFFPPDYTFSVLGGGPTLPFFPLLMALSVMGLGYLDIWSNVIKEETGDAYLPGDCFWDPLNIIVGLDDAERRKMQAREVWNGRFAMVAFMVFVVEEAATKRAVIDLEWNELFFRPVFAVPEIMDWLDVWFSEPSSALFPRN
mmetsp:Transcript_967/g.1734  ORF Transcript_967/g.1734 Transcript_967/m.1734 type:complete len:359 (+) Transcript_967:102-1178(+)